MMQRRGKRMKLGIAMATVEHSMQGKTPTFHDLATTVHAAEEIGLDSFWRADHLLYRLAEISLIQPGEQAFFDEKALPGSPEELAEHLQTFADAGR